MMQTPTPPALPLTHSAYAQGYEQIRRHALEPGMSHDRQGLAVMARRGIAAWLFVSAELPTPPAGVCAGVSPGALPARVEKPVIDILLAMVKVHMEGEFA